MSTTQVEYHDLRGRTTAVERIRDHRRVEVGRMILARVPIRVMAERLSVSTRTVQKDIRVVERWWAESALKDRAALIKRESVKYDELEAAWMGRAMFDAVALDNVLRIMAARSKLQGLNAPVQSQVEIVGSVDELRSRALEIVQDDLTRRRELRERAQLGDVIDVQSTERTG